MAFFLELVVGLINGLECREQTVEITKKGQRVPVMISGRYYKNKSMTYATVGIQVIAVGECQFGDAVRKVCVIDQNRNFVLGDVTTSQVGTREYKTADACLIADEQGRFRGSTASPSARIGQPILVGGKW